jgi:hypothetical protein
LYTYESSGAKRVSRHCNQRACRIVLQLAVAAAALLFSAGPCPAQFPQLLQITSPADGTVAHPGETITVVVAVPSEPKLMMAGPWGDCPLSNRQFRAGAPYTFSVTIAKDVREAGKCRLMILGATSPGHPVDSAPINLDIEPAGSPVNVKLEGPFLFKRRGERLPLSLTAIFSDGSAMDLTRSERITYTVTDPAVASVTSWGTVTAEGFGTFGAADLIIRFGNQTYGVPIFTRSLSPYEHADTAGEYFSSFEWKEAGLRHPPLRITSPADGVVVHPGERVAVEVTPNPGTRLTAVTVVAQSPIVSGAIHSAPPFCFAVAIPQAIRVAGKYYVTASGATGPEGAVDSLPVALDVEPPAPIVRVEVRPQEINAVGLDGEYGFTVTGTFSDGAVFDITRSSKTNYAVGDSSCARLDRRGMPMLVAVSESCSTQLIIQYEDQNVTLPVDVRPFVLQTPKRP